MWLLGRLQPDYKSIAEFRRMHSQAVTEAGAELVRLARSVGLVKGDTVAVDGSKFRAVSSAKRGDEALSGAVGRRRRAGRSGDRPERGASGAGETAERSGAGSTVYAHGQWTCSRLQRANGGGCRARTDCGA